MKRVLIGVIMFVVLLVIIIPEPEYCLLKEKKWKSEELDITLVISEEYPLTVFDYFIFNDHSVLNEIIEGELKLDNMTYPFKFANNHALHDLSFGNLYIEKNIFDVLDYDDGWEIYGDFSVLFNTRRLVFKISGVNGISLPESIKTLTFTPVEE